MSGGRSDCTGRTKTLRRQPRGWRRVGRPSAWRWARVSRVTPAQTQRGEGTGKLLPPSLPLAGRGDRYVSAALRLAPSDAPTRQRGEGTGTFRPPSLPPAGRGDRTEGGPPCARPIWMLLQDRPRKGFRPQPTLVEVNTTGAGRPAGCIGRSAPKRCQDKE